MFGNRMRLGPFILLMAVIVHPCFSCPTDPTLLQRCSCTSSFNGILLDCSGSSFSETLQMLKLHRNELGLMQELTFQNSSVPILEDGTFNGLYIKKLDLSSCGVHTVRKGAFAGLQDVLQIVTMKNNRLTSVPTDALAGLGSLLQIDFAKNDIGDLPGEVFRSTPKLYDVNLSGNRICFVNKDAFENIKTALQILNIGQNCLDKVPAPAIRGCPQLLALHLNENKLRHLDALEIINLPQLNLINLSGNNISSLHPQAFLNVPNLKFLYLGSNELQHISPTDFRPLEKLELLDLSQNRIQEVPTSSFANMPQLSQLYLPGNRIRQISGNAFANSSVVILLLNDNMITSVTQEMFIGLSYLQQLSLKKNKISTVEPNAFYQLPSLVVLDLSHNEISSLPPSSFIGQLNMYLLDLSHNLLPSVPYSSVNQRIVTVVLQENPLVCVERVHVIQQSVGLYVPGSRDDICQTNSSIKPSQATILGPGSGFIGGQGELNRPTGFPGLPAASNGFQQGNGFQQPFGAVETPTERGTLPPFFATTVHFTPFPGFSPPKPINGHITTSQPRFVIPFPGGSSLQGSSNGGFIQKGSFSNSGTPDESNTGNNPRTPINQINENSNRPVSSNQPGRNRGNFQGIAGRPGANVPPPRPPTNTGAQVPSSNHNGVPQQGKSVIHKYTFPSTNTIVNPGIPKPENTRGWQGVLGPQQEKPNPNIGVSSGRPSLPTPRIVAPSGSSGNTPAANHNGNFGRPLVGPSNQLPLFTISLPTVSPEQHGPVTPPFSFLQRTTRRPQGIFERTPADPRAWTQKLLPTTAVPTTTRNPWERPSIRLGPTPLPPFQNSHPDRQSPPTASLPPGIIVAGEGHVDEAERPWKAGQTLPVYTPKPEDANPVRTLAPGQIPKDNKPNGPDFARSPNDSPNVSNHGSPAPGKKPSSGTATTIIVVALTVVVVVLLVVFVTLCIVRHRSRLGKTSDSSSGSRTSAYVAAQAAQVNYNVNSSSSSYNGGNYVRPSPPRPPMKSPEPSTSNAWLYAPGTYAAAGSYYDK